MILKDVTRKQAFLTHLGVSSVIFLVLVYFIVFQWYPDFYFTLDGGLRGITTIFVVDVVLGPGLTLLVFKPGKKSLRFDMAVILIMQISALSWGVHSVYSERSGAAVFYWGKLSCVSERDTENMDMTAISRGPGGKQRLAFLDAPETTDQFFDFVKKPFMAGSSEIYYYADKIKPFDENVVNKLNRYELGIQQVKAENESHAAAFENYIEQNRGNNTSYKLIPISCRYGNAVAVYDTERLRIRDLIRIDTSLRAADSMRLVPDNISVHAGSTKK